MLKLIINFQKQYILFFKYCYKHHNWFILFNLMSYYLRTLKNYLTSTQIGFCLARWTSNPKILDRQHELQELLNRKIEWDKDNRNFLKRGSKLLFLITH